MPRVRVSASKPAADTRGTTIDESTSQTQTQLQKTSNQTSTGLTPKPPPRIRAVAKPERGHQTTLPFKPTTTTTTIATATTATTLQSISKATAKPATVKVSAKTKQVKADPRKKGKAALGDDDGDNDDDYDDGFIVNDSRSAVQVKTAAKARSRRDEDYDEEPEDEDEDGSVDDSDSDPDFNHGANAHDSDDYKEADFSDDEPDEPDYDEDEDDEDDYGYDRKRKRGASATPSKSKSNAHVKSPPSKKSRPTSQVYQSSKPIPTTNLLSRVASSPYAKKVFNTAKSIAETKPESSTSSWITPHPNRLTSVNSGSLFLNLDAFRFKGTQKSESAPISKTLIPEFSSDSEDERAGNKDSEQANVTMRQTRTSSGVISPKPGSGTTTHQSSALSNVYGGSQNIRTRARDEDDDENGGVDDADSENNDAKSSRSQDAEHAKSHSTGEFKDLFSKLIDECVLYSEKMQEILQRWKQSTERSEAQRKHDPSVSALHQPITLTRKLHAHQIVALSWLRLLRLQNMNGILADEMGLGKTITIIAYLEYLRGIGESGPHLIIVPSSTVENWLREFSVWAPELNVTVYRGTLAERSKFRKTFDQQNTNALITTYSLCYRKEDRSFFKNVYWNQLILDEGHSIKNAESAIHQRLAKIPSRYRLLVTGTPLQNNLTELWALLNFLMPKIFEKFKDIFHREEDLNQAFASQFEGESTSDRKMRSIMQIRKCLEPFMLRRVRSDLTDLIQKVEIMKGVDMCPAQRAIYEETLKSSRNMWERHQKDQSKPQGSSAKKEELCDELDDEGMDQTNRRKLQDSTVSGKGLLQNILMQLRKIANHPCLGYSKYDDNDIEEIAKVIQKEQLLGKSLKLDDIINNLYGKNDFQIHQLCELSHSLEMYCLSPEQLFGESGKLVALKAILADYHSKGARVLLFSQMTKLLDILEAFLHHLGFKFLRLDGSTPVLERQALIDQYNTDKSIFVFLLSTKAGGFGINLSSANVVIFHDLDFNPEVDRQAEARCIRPAECLEQKTVDVVKLISNGTVDTYIHQRSQTKKEVNDAMLGGGQRNQSEETSESLTGILRSIFESSK